MTIPSCALCSVPQGDATCAACCQEGMAYDARVTAERIRAILLLTDRELRTALSEWASRIDTTADEAEAAVRELREDPEWEP